MPVMGTCKLTRLQLAQLTIDLTKNPATTSVLMALLDPETGQAAYIRSNGSTWGEETLAATKQLISCLEADVARLVFTTATTLGTEKPDQKQVSSIGLGEHLTGAEVPDM